MPLPLRHSLRTPARAHTHGYNRYLVGSVCRHSVPVGRQLRHAPTHLTPLSFPPHPAAHRNVANSHFTPDLTRAHTHVGACSRCTIHYTVRATVQARSFSILYLQTAYYPHGRFYAKIFGGLASPSSSLPISYPSPSSLPLEVKGKKVKFSHTRYRALGPELIPVYRQSARR